jgi:hypothetical protein
VCTSAETLAKTETAPFVYASSTAHGSKSRPAILFAPDAAASTASHPNVRDDGQRPSSGTGRMAKATDLPEKKSEIFFAGGLDRILLICPVRQSEWTPTMKLSIIWPSRPKARHNPRYSQSRSYTAKAST